MEATRLNKYIAQCGVCSRRDADKLIEQGKVKLNGRIAVMGDKAVPSDEVTVNGKLIGGRNKLVVLAYHKPPGVTCTEKDKYAEKTIKDVLDYPVRVTYAGRLDKDSEGLLILTNDGELAEAMMRGANKHEKEYIVTVNKGITQEFIKRLASGVFLKELNITTRKCRVEQKGKYTFHVILTQGVNRQLRRMCKELGYEAKKIVRIRVMNICLNQLKSGTYRRIVGEELQQLYREAGK